MEIGFSLKVNFECCFPLRNLTRMIIHLHNGSINTIILFLVCYHQGKYTITQELTQCNTSRQLKIYIGC